MLLDAEYQQILTFTLYISISYTTLEFICLLQLQRLTVIAYQRNNKCALEVLN